MKEDISCFRPCPFYWMSYQRLDLISSFVQRIFNKVAIQIKGGINILFIVISIELDNVLPLILSQKLLTLIKYFLFLFSGI